MKNEGFEPVIAPKYEGNVGSYGGYVMFQRFVEQTCLLIRS